MIKFSNHVNQINEGIFDGMCLGFVLKFKLLLNSKEYVQLSEKVLFLQTISLRRVIYAFYAVIFGTCPKKKQN